MEDFFCELDPVFFLNDVGATIPDTPSGASASSTRSSTRELAVFYAVGIRLWVAITAQDTTMTDSEE